MGKQAKITDFWQSVKNKARKRNVKKRKIVKNKFLLSKTATLLHVLLSFPREICNLIGQFMGTDIPFFRVGELYVAYYPWSDFFSGYSLVGTSDHVEVGCRGGEFFVYEVLRRTACRIKIELKEVYNLYKYKDVFTALECGILLNITGDYHTGVRTVKPWEACAIHLRTFEDARKKFGVCEIPEDGYLSLDRYNNKFVIKTKSTGIIGSMEHWKHF